MRAMATFKWPHNSQLLNLMSHLYILTDAETEAVNGGFFDAATNIAVMPQTNTLLAVPVATGGVAGFGLFGLAGGGDARVNSFQGNIGLVRQRARA